MIKQVTLAIVVAGVLLAAVLDFRDTAATAGPETSTPPGAPTGLRLVQNDPEVMTATATMRQPHHLLAMAYQANLRIFATTLRDRANNGDGFVRDFAVTAVAEIRRSFDEMQKHHLRHAASMDVATRTTMTASMRRMAEQRAAIDENLVALEAELDGPAPDSRSIVRLTGELLANCTEMSKGMVSVANTKSD